MRGDGGICMTLRLRHAALLTVRCSRTRAGKPRPCERGQILKSLLFVFVFARFPKFSHHCFAFVYWSWVC